MKDFERKRLKELIKRLDSIRGMHTELVSVYIPSGYSLPQMVSQIRNEQSTAMNIKSKTVRKNVTGALERILQHMKLYKETPPNGLVVFCGNVSEKEGVSDIQVFALEPPEKINTKLYFCDQKFVLDPLKSLIREKEIYGLMVLDKSEASIGLIRGKNVEQLKHLESIVPGKSKKGGQCLSADTLLMKDDGDIVRIIDCHNPMSLKSVNLKNFSVTNSQIKDKWETNKKTIKITTKSPRFEIEASPDHIFFIENGGAKERPAESLRKGDRLLIPEKIEVDGEKQKLNVKNSYESVSISKEGRRILKLKRIEKFGYQRLLAKKLGLTQSAISFVEIGRINIDVKLLKKRCEILGINFQNFLKRYCTISKKTRLPKFLNEEFAQILGYFMGDGSFDTNKICFHENDLQTARIYQKSIKTLLNTNCTLRARKERNYHLLRAYSKELVNLLKNEFPEMKDSTTSTMPKKVLKSKNKVLASFLRGFFDAEGYVSGPRIGLGINNRHLAREIQLCLLRFGIVASVYEDSAKRNPYSDKHRFTIQTSDRESLEKFDNEIGFSFPKKLQKLRNVLRNKTGRNYTRQLLIPGSEIRKTIYKHGLNTNKFQRVTNFFRDERKMSKWVFKNSILAEIKDNKKLYNELKKILDIHILPAEISKIEITKKQKMVDISVLNQNFLANGLLVHNSAARFARVREGLLFDFLKKIGEVANQQFQQLEDLKGIIIGGPGPLKERMVKEGFLMTELKNKILGVVDTSYSGEYGLDEIVERSEEIISKTSIMKEKKVMDRFFNELAKDTGLAVYGIREVLGALAAGNLETLLISEDFEWVKARQSCACGYKKEKLARQGQKESCPKCGSGLHAEEADILDEIGRKAEQAGTDVEMISTGIPKGVQLKELGGIGGILRFKPD
jgi:peptide subunit release factor 1 (eRF1)/intein/homing endonuclease